jgi:agmatinase/guanidinopropionase
MLPENLEKPNPAYGAHLDSYAGIPSFLRQPATRDLEGVDVAIVGIPFDSGATGYRSGTRLGPRKIREASLIMWGYNPNLKVAPLDVLKIVDYGDVAVVPVNIEATMQAVTTEVAAVLAQGPGIVALGGDHSITLPLLRAHAEKFGPLAVIHFDSHRDTEPGEFHHGTPFRHAVEEGLIDTRAFIQVGIRGPLSSAEHEGISTRLGARVLSIDECFAVGIPAVVQAIRSVVGERQAYVSLDIDAVDPAYAPGTGTPEVGGFTSYQMMQLMRGLRGLNLVGFDLVEVSPPYDAGDITSILAANLVFEYLSVLAARSSPRPTVTV